MMRWRIRIGQAGHDALAEVPPRFPAVDAFAAVEPAQGGEQPPFKLLFRLGLAKKVGMVALQFAQGIFHYVEGRVVNAGADFKFNEAGEFGREGELHGRPFEGGTICHCSGFFGGKQRDVEVVWNRLI